MKWEIEDVRAATIVATLSRQPVAARCCLCERPFAARQWVSLSVSRDGVGGTTVDLCGECAAANWGALLARLDQVAEMFSAATLQGAPE